MTRTGSEWGDGAPETKLLMTYRANSPVQSCQVPEGPTRGQTALLLPEGAQQGPQDSTGLSSPLGRWACEPEGSCVEGFLFLRSGAVLCQDAPSPSFTSSRLTAYLCSAQMPCPPRSPPCPHVLEFPQSPYRRVSLPTPTPIQRTPLSSMWQ